MNLGCTYFPQRYLVAFMMFLQLAMVYIFRGTMSLTFKIISQYDELQLDKCSADLKGLGEKKQSQILVSYFYAYAICHLPAALLTKRIGGKHAVVLGALIMSISSIMLPFAACFSTYTLIAVESLMGISAGLIISALVQVNSQWSPKNERTLLSASISGGGPVGTLVTWMMTGTVISLIKWQFLFMILGAVGIVWCLTWSVICYDKPSQHPYITTMELDYLTKNVPKTHKEMPTPWIAMLKSKPFWALTVATMGHDYGYYTIVMHLPTYYHDVSQMSHFQNTDVSMLAFIPMYLVTVLLGYLSDRIIAVKWTTATDLRRFLATLGVVGPGIGMVCASYQTNTVSQVILITMFMASMSFCFITLRVNPFDLNYNHAAVIVAVANGGGSVGGLVAQTVVEAILNGKSTKNCEADVKTRKWQNIYWVMFAVQIISNIPFLMYGSGEVQNWDNPDRVASQSNQINGNATTSEELYSYEDYTTSHTTRNTIVLNVS